MDVFNYYYNIMDQRNGIEYVTRRYAYIIFSNVFFKKFDDIPGFDSNILGIPLYLFKKYKSKGFITMIDLKEEFRECVGFERFEKEKERYPDEFEKTFLLVQRFCQEAEEEYYSGCLGKLRKLFRGHNDYGKYQKMD